MKRLFGVTTIRGHVLRLKDVPPSLGYVFTHPSKPNDIMYFDNKQEAKVLRDLYPEDCVLFRGPDHNKEIPLYD